MNNTVEIPEGVGKALFEAAGVDPSDNQFQLMAINLNAIGLAGTVCGQVANRPFDRDAIRILKRAKVSFVAAVVDSSLLICSMAVRLDKKSAERLASLVNERSGSLRLDRDVDGWQIFESE
jgi:hypothetical protein